MRLKRVPTQVIFIAVEIQRKLAGFLVVTFLLMGVGVYPSYNSPYAYMFFFWVAVYFLIPTQELEDELLERRLKDEAEAAERKARADEWSTKFWSEFKEPRP